MVCRGGDNIDRAFKLNISDGGHARIRFCRKQYEAHLVPMVSTAPFVMVLRHLMTIGPRACPWG
jgi:hypothetical protein